MLPEEIKLLLVSDDKSCHRNIVKAFDDVDIIATLRHVTTTQAFIKQLRHQNWDAAIYHSTGPEKVAEIDLWDLLSHYEGLTVSSPLIVIGQDLSRLEGAAYKEAGVIDFIPDNKLSRLPLALVLERSRRKKLEEHIEIENLQASKRDDFDQGQRYRLMLDDQSDLICEYNKTGALTFVNRAFCCFFGVTEKQAVGQNLFSFLPKKESERLQMQIFSLSSGEMTGDIVHEAVRYDKAVRWLERKDRAIGDRHGVVMRFQAICRDITERRRMESALRDSESRFRDFAAVSSDWLWEMGPDLRFSYVSEQLRNALNVEPEYFLGKSWAELVDNLDEDAHHMYQNRVEVRRPYRDIIHRLSLPHQKKHYIRHHGLPMFDGDGYFQGYRGTSSQVTEAVESQIALGHAEEKLRHAISSLSEAFAIFDQEKKLVTANQPFWDSVSEEIAIGSDYQAVLENLATLGYFLDHGETCQQRVAGILAKHLQGDAQEITDSEGRWYRMEERATQDGGFVFIRTDITELKLSEVKFKALAQQNAKFAAALEKTASGVILCDPRLPGTPIMWTNHAFTDITGYERQDVLGRSPRFLQGAGTAFEAKDALNQAVKEEVSAKVEILNYKANGTAFWNELSITPIFDSDACLDSWVGILTDITERKLAVDQLMALADENTRFAKAIAETPSGVVILDLLGKDRFIISFVNRAFTKISGYSYEDCVGRDIGFLEGPETDRAIAHDLRTALLEARSVRHELLHYRKDQNPFWNEMSVGPILSEGGRAATFVCVCNDISDRRRMEEQLRQSQKMEVIGQLTGGIAHDFNNLLTIIAGNLQLLSDDVQMLHQADSPKDSLLVNSSEMAELVQEALSATRQATDVTRGLLTFSRKKSSELQSVDVNHQVCKARALLSRTLGETVRLITDLPSGLPRALCDVAQLEAALLNLSLNARDAMMGGGELTLRTCLIPADHPKLAEQNLNSMPYIVLSVTDTGCGIPEALLEKVMEPLFTTKAQGKGTGLGLPMVQRFVKSCGGGLHIASEMEKGTEVSLYLPAIAKEVGYKTLGDGHSLPRGSEHILVVDDEAGIRRFAKRCLEALGYHVSEAEDGEMALAFLEAQAGHVDLIFSDIKMPRKSGAELAAIVRRRWPNMRLCLATGSPGSEDHGRNLLGEDVVILSKPYNRHALASAIRHELDQT